MKKSKNEGSLKGSKKMSPRGSADHSPRTMSLVMENFSNQNSPRYDSYEVEDLEVEEAISKLSQNLGKANFAESEESEDAKMEREIDEYQLPNEVKQKLSSAIKGIESNQSLSSRFRSELQEYVTFMEEKTSKIDGEKLIKIPKNFDTIVNAMTREDLFDEEISPARNNDNETINNAAMKEDTNKLTTGKKSSQRPPLPNNKLEGLPGKYQNIQQLKKDNKQAWYRYLMEDYVNKDMNKEYDGRYSNLLLSSTAEDKVKKGMAEILLLDRELFQLTKKAELSDVTPRSRQSTPSDAGMLQTPKSTASGRHGFDRTFITNKNNSNNNGSKSFSAASSPRTARSQKKEMMSKGESEDIEDDNYDGEGEGGSRSQQLFAHQKLTEEQQKRVTELLEIDDDELDSHFAYVSKEDKERDDDITRRLREFGHLSRLSEEGKGSGVITMSEGKKKRVVTKIFSKEDGNDYLRQQREERKEKEEEKKIDRLLSSLGDNNKETNYLHFFEEDNNSTHSRSYYNPSLHEIPKISEIRLDVPITRDDINVLVNNLKKDLSTANNTSSHTPNTRDTHDTNVAFSIQGEDEEQDEEDEENPPVNNCLLANKEDIQQLLSSLQTEVRRLQLYRNKHDNNTFISKDNDQTNNHTNDCNKDEGNSPPLTDRDENIKMKNDRENDEKERARPFSPSDFEVIPATIRIQPPSSINQSPSRSNNHNNSNNNSNNNRQQQHPPPPLVFPPIRSSQQPPLHNLQQHLQRGRSAETSEAIKESSNPYSVNRRIKAKQPTTSNVSAGHDTGSPRQQRVIYRNTSSRGSEPDPEAALEMYGDYEEQEEDEEERSHSHSLSAARRSIAGEFDMEGEEEEGERESNHYDDSDNDDDHDARNHAVEDRLRKKKLLVEKVRQFVEI